MAGQGQDLSSSPSSLLGARNPQLSLDLSNAGPPPPALVFHPAEAGSEPQSPVSPSRSRVIRFKSRVRIASSSRPRHSYTSTTAGSSRARSASPESRRATSAQESDSDSDASDADSDSSSISAPLRDDAHRTHEPPSPMPSLPAPQAQPTATYVVLGPAYGWSEHTPLIPKGFLRPQRARSSSHYSSDAELNAELARAQAAAKRTEEDVRCSQMKDGWRSGQWWWWKIRQELCCCCVDDDSEDE